ncbi:FAD-dependent monooxygenase [Ectopseudomonas hydrolytica]|uniref:FAD-dependent monooxygenase n=1 Tax=Ectopseudomonas hydrolytica TaxID=2493633 RepID=UPI003EDFCC90
MSAQNSAPVIIIGAGGTGCTLALLLASYNIPSILVERRTSALQHPAAHVINGRSFEIWSQYSPELANEIMALSPELEEFSEVRWCVSLLGKELGRINLLEPAERVAQGLTYSPYRVAHIGQHLLMPVLWRWVEAEPLITFLKGVSLESFQDREPGVVVNLLGADRKKRVIQGDWLIGADGANSAVRDQLGVRMEGPVLANMASVFFKMKLDQVHPGPRPLLSWIYNQSFCGVLIKHADDDYILMSPFISADQNMATGGAEYWKKIIPKAIGSDQTPFQIHTTGRWSMTAQLATTYSRGKTLLIGDAAHRFPHTGGFGLNSGVQDAHNVAWKLAAVLEGRATASLMQTYEVERKPVINLFSAQSVNNHFKLDEVTRHIRIGNRDLMKVTKFFESAPIKLLPRQMRKWLAESLMFISYFPARALDLSSSKGEQLRIKFGKEIPGQVEHFLSTGLEYGYAYNAGLIHPEGTPQPLIDKGVTDYRPTTWPGSRLPHVMVDCGGKLTPIHSLIDKRLFTLVTADSDSWQHAISAHPKKVDLGINVVSLSALTPDDRQAAIALYEVGEFGAVLVRPDHHIAWRTTDGASTAVQLLVDIANQIFAPYRCPEFESTNEPVDEVRPIVAGIPRS